MYDEALADRIRAELSRQTPFTERKMFGGLAFLINGHMACGVVRDELMVRTGPEWYEAALAMPHAPSDGLHGPRHARNGDGGPAGLRRRFAPLLGRIGSPGRRRPAAEGPRDRRSAQAPLVMALGPAVENASHAS